MDPNTIYLILWCLWGAAFFAIETPALLDHEPGGTLSEFVWAFLGIGKPLKGWVRWRRIAFIGFSAWMMLHFFTGGWV